MSWTLGRAIISNHFDVKASKVSFMERVSLLKDSPQKTLWDLTGLTIKPPKRKSRSNNALVFIKHGFCQ